MVTDRFAVLALSMVCAAVSGQAPTELQFSELGKRHLPVQDDITQALCHCDVDGDGDLDLILGNHGHNQLCLNDGFGVFTDVTTQQLPPNSDYTTSIACGDIDGDGDIDLLIGNGSDQNRVYINDGTGVFTDQTASHLPPSVDATDAIILGDIDNDGDLDLFCGNWLGEMSRLYSNDGSGVFTDVTATQLPATLSDIRAAAFADVDGDGDLDIATGYPLLINNGSGVFVDGTSTNLPLPWVSGQAVAIADVDNDGDGDLIIGRNYQNQLLLNDGNGVFTNVSTTHLPALTTFTLSIAVGDIDGDGDLDIVCGNIEGDQDGLYLNDGSGVFTDATASLMPVSTAWSSAVTLADIDANGSLDLFIAKRTINFGLPNALYFNNGSGEFSPANAHPFPNVEQSNYTTAVAAGDLDGDGDLDIVYGNRATTPFPSAQNRLFLNEGIGVFTDATASRMPTNADNTQAIALGDVDGDSDLDMVTGNFGQANQLYLNDGTGTFSTTPPAQLPPTTNSCRSVALGDVDGDGDLDIAFGTGYAFNLEQNNLYINDGSGVFSDASATQLPQHLDQTMCITLVDVDNDGDLDMVCACWIQQNRLLLNDGSGTFTDATAAKMPPSTPAARSISAGDVDGDGDMDLAVGNDPYPNSLYLNDGTGTFTDVSATQLPGAISYTRSIHLRDIDGDNDLDMVCGNDEENSVLLNDGQGFFTSSTKMPSDTSETWCMVLADVGNDGDLDVLTGNRGPNRLYHNLQRHLDAPHVLRTGQAYRLHTYRRTANTQPTSFAFPFLSTTRVVIPLPPLGVLGIDPVLALPAGAILQPEGVHSSTWMVPNTPGIEGIAIYGQALLVSGDLRLTNVTSDVIK